jgi:nickel-type superoxide dismutase maturation protease
LTARPLAEWIAPLAAVAAILLAAGEFVALPWVVAGGSMAPALLPGDRVLVDRWTFHHREPRIGEVVLVEAPGGAVVVKRVAGMRYGGDVWVLGDDREASTDSRHFGPVGRDRLRGRVVWRYWPPDRAGPVAVLPER